ncbi:DNA-binding transcriptional repressor [Legionella pneumophila]|nr:Cold acclimation protein B [Legionella pneumophila]STX84413.1 DNA-binding transcriptional repressor [Legionella pneumophila]
MKARVLALLEAVARIILSISAPAIQGSGFKTLPEGANVLFKAGRGQKGPQAEDVELVK